MHFIDDAPPPSYDQIDHAHPSSDQPDQPIPAPRISGFSDLSEKVVEQHQVIQVQELEIGKLKRDLGRIREQMERIEQQKSVPVPIPAKLEHTLAQVVGEEEEQRRQSKRSRKGDIIGGLVCAAALLAVLGLGLYIVVFSKPPMTRGDSAPLSRQLRNSSTSTNMTTTSSSSTTTTSTSSTTMRPSPVVRQFRIVGKVDDDALCWARAQVNGRELRCNVFKRASADPQLLCTFGLAARTVRTRARPFAFPLPVASRRGKPLIVLEGLANRRCGRTTVSPSVECAKNGTTVGDDQRHTHVLSMPEAARARATCIEQSPFRFGERRRARGRTRSVPAPLYWALRHGHRHQRVVNIE